MRRAAIRAFRNARQVPIRPTRRLLTQRAHDPNVTVRGWNSRSFTTTASARNPAQRYLMTHQQYTRNFILTLCSSLIFSATWIYHKEGYSGLQPNARSPDTPKSLSAAQLASISTSSLAAVNPLRPNGAAQPEETSSEQSLLQDSNVFFSDDAIDVPLSKPTEEQNYHMGTLNPDEATKKLRSTEESYLIGRGNGVVRYDLVQIPSNNPIEDDHAEKIISVDQNITPAPEGADRSDWMFWGVFDGHSGWTTSTRLRQSLISYVARELSSTYKSASAETALRIPTPEAINDAIKRGFLTLDYDIVHKAVEKTLTSSTKRASTEALAPALSGSCALLSFYDSSSKLLRVACTGDSRAVLGRKAGAGKWTATPLSEDQTGGTPSEMARLRAEHPGEEHVFYKGRILGALEPSRAFGDASYKWTREIQDKVKRYFFGRTPNPLLQTPPYVTAEPIITTTKVEPEKGDFLVLATDGLWEMLTNEEVVGLVGRWLEKEESRSSGSSWMGSFFSPASEKNLPVEKPVSDPKKGDQAGQRAPIRQLQYDIQGTDERFVVEDKNVATHLVRNALGGRDSDLVCALLSLVSPTSRRYRYDSVSCRQ